MKQHSLSELVLDFDVYPRGDVDAHHVTEIVTAIEAGAELPPIIIDKKSKRVTDGFHRWKALRRVYGEDHKTQCIEKDYKDERELFVDAMRYNASHGRALTVHDKTHCLILAEKLNIPENVVAESLNLTVNRVSDLRVGRIGRSGNEAVPLKSTIRHMGGKRLNKRQVQANRKLSGMNQVFYVNQVIELIESDLIDRGNDDLMKRLDHLSGLLADIQQAA